MTRKMIYKTTTVFVILSICLSSFQIQLSHAVEVLCSKHEFNMALVHLKTCSIQGKTFYKIPKIRLTKTKTFVYKKSQFSKQNTIVFVKVSNFQKCNFSCSHLLQKRTKKIPDFCSSLYNGQWVESKKYRHFINLDH